MKILRSIIIISVLIGFLLWSNFALAYEFYTVNKFDTNGGGGNIIWPDTVTRAIWTYKYNENDFDMGTGLALDSSDNPYFTGTKTVSGRINLLTTKLNSNTGAENWSRVYADSNPFIFADYGIGGTATYTKGGNTYVYSAGVSWGFNFFFFPVTNFRVIKYNSSDGSVVWNKTLPMDNFYFAKMAADSSGNLYIVKSSLSGTTLDLHLRKYDENAALLWEKKYVPGPTSVPNNIGVDPQNNPYITAYTNYGSALNYIIDGVNNTTNPSLKPGDVVYYRNTAGGPGAWGMVNSAFTSTTAIIDGAILPNSTYQIGAITSYNSFHNINGVSNTTIPSYSSYQAGVVSAPLGGSIYIINGTSNTTNPPLVTNDFIFYQNLDTGFMFFGIVTGTFTATAAPVNFMNLPNGTYLIQKLLPSGPTYTINGTSNTTSPALVAGDWIYYRNTATTTWSTGIVTGNFTATTSPVDGANLANGTYEIIKVYSASGFTVSNLSVKPDQALSPGNFIYYYNIITKVGSFGIVTGDFTATTSPVNGTNLANGQYIISKIDNYSASTYTINGSSNTRSPSLRARDLIYYRDSGACHWCLVDDIAPDDDSTKVWTDSATEQKDAYQLEDPPPGASGTINKIRVRMRYQGTMKTYFRLNGAESSSFSTASAGGAWSNYTTSWQPSRPGGGSWSWNDVRDLQVAIGLSAYTSGFGTFQGKVTQVYVEVDYDSSTLTLRPNADGDYTNIESPPYSAGGPGSWGMVSGNFTATAAPVNGANLANGTYQIVRIASGEEYTIDGADNTLGLSNGDIIYYRDTAVAGPGSWGIVTGDFTATSSPVNGANLANGTYDIATIGSMDYRMIKYDSAGSGGLYGGRIWENKYYNTGQLYGLFFFPFFPFYPDLYSLFFYPFFGPFFGPFFSQGNIAFNPNLGPPSYVYESGTYIPSSPANLLFGYSGFRAVKLSRDLLGAWNSPLAIVSPSFLPFFFFGPYVGVGVDSSRNVYQAATIYGPFSWLFYPSFSSSIAMVKHDNAGNFLWGKFYKTSFENSDFVTGLAVDPIGNIYLRGRHYNPASVIPPTASNVSATSPSYCSTSPSYTFSWTYNSTAGLNESRFVLEIDNNSDFSSQEVIKDFAGLSNPPGTINTQAVSVVESPGPDQLAYNTTYYWRVQVWDSNGTGSGWTTPVPATFVTAAHRYPDATFTYSPSNPKAGQPVTFTADPDPTADPDRYGPYTWAWDFNGDGTTDSTGASPQTYTYSATGNYNATLTVIDSSIFACTYSRNVGVGARGRWREVIPR